jgi:hypothetical protein
MISGNGVNARAFTAPVMCRGDRVAAYILHKGVLIGSETVVSPD